jgi:hypothetical protein
MSMHGRNLRRILALVPLILKTRSDRFTFQFGVRKANEVIDQLQEQLRGSLLRFCRHARNQEFCSTKNLRPYRHNLQIVGIWSFKRCDLT